MADTSASMRQKLKVCDLQALFIEELGWDHHRAIPLVVEDDEVKYELNAIAEKHGMVAYECRPGPQGKIPDYSTRSIIERHVAKSAHEHIVVFVNQDRTIQTWQWVRREKGKPTARREHTYTCSQPGDSLIQKLQNLMVSLEEEEKLTIVDVTGKVKKAFDVDHVTKRFFDRFQKEHAAFLSFIDGITAVADREWYASLMLNRLMFIYFIQKKGFLDGDIHYLRNRLQVVRQSQGKDKFHSFYRQFLRRLFHEGLAQRKEARSTELNALLGNVPYLNGGLFDMHQLEKDNSEVNIPDEAFEKLFDFFDDYQWHLDERPVRKDDEINPDVLGYIFEKYINQKQMGAYYTKEDITEYIGKSAIVPFLFDAAEKKCAIAFRPEGSVWRLLRDDPDRYIYDAVKKGVDLPLPEDIAAGVSEVSKRGGWNHPADDEFALPTETWREYMSRRTRCLEVRAKLASGEIHSINDLITYNLNLRQFAQDVIETCEGPDLLRAFYKSIVEMSVLDLTCGSGAFLFAALNILEPLYEACLERMEVFVSDLDKFGEKHHPEKFSDFRKVLEHANDRTKHPSRRYFILKSIVLRNLYGVDIMAEAVEICKLRLFLKLVAQVERVEDVEPLPDIDFNIRAGNTLVGFTSLEAVRTAMIQVHTKIGVQARAMTDEDRKILQRIEEDAELADKAFGRFLEQQTDYGMLPSQYSATKNDLQTRLAALRIELDRYLATEYGIDLLKPANFEKWRSSHQPFHWFVEFYRIMKDGGFAVLIGNPPYVEYSKVKDKYTLLDEYEPYSTNLWSACCYKSTELSHKAGYSGFIVPVSLPSTDRMEAIRLKLLEDHLVYQVGFSTRPSKLFEGTEQRLMIYVRVPCNQSNLYSGGYLKWYKEERPALFPCINFVESLPLHQRHNIWPKLKGSLHSRVYHDMYRQRTMSELGIIAKGGRLYYKNTGLRYFNTVTLRAPQCWINGNPATSSRETILEVQTRQLHAIHALLLSTTFFIHWETTSNCRDLNPSDISLMPTPSFNTDLPELGKLSEAVETDYISKSKIIKMQNKLTGLVEIESVTPAGSKPIIDEIDRVIAADYSFTEEELDFIINYDIKYRMGKDSDAEDD